MHFHGTTITNCALVVLLIVCVTGLAIAGNPAGDGNLDKLVNGKDLLDWWSFQSLSSGTSSWYDLNFDGLTNDADRVIIQQHLGTNCLK